MELGGTAKKRALGLLTGGPFTLYTRWQPVFRSGRFFAFARSEGGEWLHETLVREGLARIYTEGAALPDGTTKKKRESRLRQVEAEAKRTGTGGWGM